MTVAAVPVDQRVIGIDSRRFASIEKALVELVTNADDSYCRREDAGAEVSGHIEVVYERHMSGAVLEVTDQAEGMSFDRASSILTYGGAHSPLSKGEGYGRGYFGRGLKQAVFGLGHGWIETIEDGRLSRIDLFRDDDAGYLFDDHGGDRPALGADRERLGITGNGTRVTIVVDNPRATISHYRTLVHGTAQNVYLRDVLTRRTLSLVHVREGREVERSERVCFEEPPATTLIGPERAEKFTLDGQDYSYSVTLKRAKGVELTTGGDERTNGLVVISGLAVLDCQLFDYENQVGTEYLFGVVRCRALTEELGRGQSIISDEREGLNRKNPLVAAFSRAVSSLLSEYVLAEREKLKHLDRASTSDRTAHMIDRLLHRMSQSAVHDLGVGPSLPQEPPPSPDGAEHPEAMRFTTPFYYRRPGHPFRVSLLLDPEQLAAADALTIDHTLPDSMHIDPSRRSIPVEELAGLERMEWTITADTPGARGEVTARAGLSWAWCEVVVADSAAHPRHESTAHRDRGDGKAEHRGRHRRRPRDHGEDMFAGYELRYLPDVTDRAIYRPDERKIIINTGAPTVQLYLDGRGHFRDSARLLLAELFLDVIADELARLAVEKTGRDGDPDAYHDAKQDIIRRYGADIHRSFT